VWLLLFIFIWPFDQATRYLLPMLSVFWLALWTLLRRTGRYRRTIMGVLLVLHLLVSAGYFAVEVAQARRDDRLWPAVDQMVQKIRAAPAPVLAVGFKGDQPEFLSFALDRRVGSIDSGAPVPAEVGWLMMAEGAATPPGFATSMSDCGIILRRRIR
jgi:hypothetical protein